MNWNSAHEWADKANEEKEPKWSEPRWSFDCGLKLDFDGGLLRVSSRFYQVKENIYDGSITFCVGDDEIFTREFSSRHIDNLRNDVEKYYRIARLQICDLLRSNRAVFIDS